MGRGRVLIVDDHAPNRAVAKATLEDEGYETVMAVDGTEALALVASQRPDCILMDIKMPGIDGIEACRRIRGLAEGADVAVLFLTAQRDVATFDRALAAGGDDFITKPFRPDELIMRVQTAMRLRRIASERSEAVAELKQQRDRLQRLELQKEQLVEFLVHDLKNPVNAIDLQAQSILRSPEITRAHLNATKIRSDTQALLRMITNLLDISRADEGRLAPSIHPVVTTELVREVFGEMSVPAEAAGVRLDSAIVVQELHADRDLLGRVLSNLIDNAIRHAPAASLVRLTIAPGGEGIEIRVSDSGVGVPADERDQVFERFLSGATTRSNRGLGLAFCKLAVEAHGGRIWIEDASPGATFCVRLPR